MANDTAGTGSRILTGTLWSMLGIAGLGLTRLAYSTLIGRTGPPGRLAEVNAQVSLTLVATFVTAAATGRGASKFIALVRTRDGLPAAAAVRRNLARWTVLVTAVALLVLAGLGRLLLPAASLADLGWVCALTAAYAAYTFTKSVLYGYGLAHRYAVLEIASDVATVLLTVVALTWADGVLLAPLVVGYTLFAALARRAVPRVRPGPMPALGSELGGFVAYTALGTVASQGLFQVAMLVARHVTGETQAGWYAAAMSLVTPAFFVPRALALAFFPAAAEAVGRGDVGSLARHTDAVTRVLAVTMLPAFALAAMLGGTALRLVFGAGYAGGAVAFAVLVAATFCYVVAVPAVNALSAQTLALARVPPLASVGGVLLATAVWVALAGRFGAAGIAAGYLAGTLSQAGVPLVLAFRRLGIRWGARFARLGGCAAVAVAATVTVVAVPRWWVITTGTVGFAVFYGIAQRRELAEALGRFRERSGERSGAQTRPGVDG